MKLDETTLIEIQDYIDALDEKVGLKPETVEDIRKAIDKHKAELKNLRLVAVSGECVHDYQLNTLKNDILCTKCGLSKYLD